MVWVGGGGWKLRLNKDTEVVVVGGGGGGG